MYTPLVIEMATKLFTLATQKATSPAFYENSGTFTGATFSIFLSACTSTCI